MYQKHVSTAKSFTELSQAEAGYLAGLIDGEGSLVISGYQLRLAVGSTHDVIIELCNAYGGSWQYLAKRSSISKKPFYDWVWNNEMMRWYLPQLLPHLKIKLEQVKIMLEALKCCYGSRREKNKQKLETYMLKLRELNAKAFPLE